jgi:hypothetical protein
VARKILDDRLTESLMLRPQIPEITPTAQQNQPLREPGSETPHGVACHVAPIDDPQARGSKEGLLAEPDGTVTHIGMIREVHERTRPMPLQERTEHFLNPPAKFDGEGYG